MLQPSLSAGKVVIANRRIQEGEEIEQSVIDMGGEAVFIQADVTQENEIKSLVERTVEHYGRLDIAFNNAGVEGPIKTLIDQTKEDFNEIININLKGMFFLFKI